MAFTEYTNSWQKEKSFGALTGVDILPSKWLYGERLKFHDCELSCGHNAKFTAVSRISWFYGCRSETSRSRCWPVCACDSADACPGPRGHAVCDLHPGARPQKSVTAPGRPPESCVNLSRVRISPEHLREGCSRPGRAEVQRTLLA